MSFHFRQKSDNAVSFPFTGNVRTMPATGNASGSYAKRSFNQSLMTQFTSHKSAIGFFVWGNNVM